MPRASFALSVFAVSFFACSVLLWGGSALLTPAQAQLFGKKEETKVTVFPGSTTPQSFADLSEKLLPSVVNISSTQKMQQGDQAVPDMPSLPPGSPFEEFFKDFMERRGITPPNQGENFPDQQGPDSFPDQAPSPFDGFPQGLPETSLGSGFIIDAAKGYVITNNHVIRDADEVRVTLHDDTTLDAKIIGRDEKTDLAVLQIKADKPLTAVPFGNSDKMRVGDWILAIGNPFGLGGTVTTGIISARQRDINAGPYDDFIQTDASINRGNSGGPMFNLAGEVIGINTAIFSPSGGSVGIGFAIPSSLAKPIIDQLIKFGKTRRGWLGVRIQTVTPEIAESLGLKEAGGALVASVTPDGPAEKANIKAGDVILEFNGQKLSAMRALPRLVAETEIGTIAKVRLFRDGKELTASIKVGELEQAEETGLIENPNKETETAGPVTEIKILGLNVSGLNGILRERFGIGEDVQGVVITDIKPTGEAAEKGLLPGDVILEINQQAITSAAQALEIVEKTAKSGKNSILFLVDHQGKGDVRFVALRLKK
jgi:serine protease Do